MKAIAALGRMAGGMEKDAALRYAAAGDASRRLVDAVERVSRRFDGLASTADARQAALKIHELWGGDDQFETPDRPASETAIASDEESGEPVKVIDTGVARGVGIAELLQRALSEFRRLLDERGGSSDEGVSGETMESGVSYEADRTRDKMTVVPTTPRPDTEAFHREVRALVGQLARRLFRDLLGQGPVWTRHRKSGSGVDPRALHRVAVDDGRVFRRRLPAPRLDAALSLLIDCSGSMAGEKIELAIRLAMAFAEACDVIDVPSEVLGFTTSTWKAPVGRTRRRTGRGAVRTIPLHHLVIQPFGRRFRAARHAFLNALRTIDLKHNVDGEAVLWAGGRLAARPERLRTLIVLSDGHPEAPLAGARRAALYEHLRCAIDHVGKSGIRIVGIGIQTDAVREFYADHVVFHRLEDLVTGGYDLISSILRGARGRV